jgi:hypothetical protein
MQYVSHITIPRLLALFALLAVGGWAWAAFDNDMPVGFAFLLCVASPVLLLVLTLYWTLDKGLGDWPSSGARASSSEHQGPASSAQEAGGSTAAAEEPSLARS